MGFTFLAIFILAIGGYFTFRQSFLDRAITKAKEKVAQDFQSQLTIGSYQFSGFNSVEMNQVCLISPLKDTLAFFPKLELSVRMLPLLQRKILFGSVETDGGRIQLVKNDSIGCNFCTFLKGKKEPKDPSQKRSIARLLYRSIDKVFDLLPSDLMVSNFQTTFLDNHGLTTFYLERINLDDQDLEGTFWFDEGSGRHFMAIAGEVDRGDLTGTLNLKPKGQNWVQLPLLESKFGLKFAFSELNLSLEDVDFGGGELEVRGNGTAKNLGVFHPRFSDSMVIIPHADASFSTLFGEDFAEIDSSTSIDFNGIPGKVYARAQTGEHSDYQLKISTYPVQAQTFFNALPAGMFGSIAGTKAEGKMDFYLDLHLDGEKPFKSTFDAGIHQDGFKLLGYGKAQLDFFNSPFEYTPIENGQPMRSRFIGSENVYFVGYSEIPSYLKNAILTCEDPSFFGHKGFVMEAFKNAIAKNYKTKQFKVGGSTISMQLVKNLFLSRKKTLSRKIEEAMIVWLIENQRISSKQRMFEVYVNMIEWGPNVYGLGEASDFYFGKSPSQLSLPECVYLATLIPRPKQYRSFFDAFGELRPYAVRHSEVITKKMASRGLLTDTDTIGFDPRVRLSGRAMNGFQLNDTVPVIFEEEPLEQDEIFE
ncbi:MAG: hypothetical protein RLY64_204 [Bacteroidota bacterium]